MSGFGSVGLSGGAIPILGATPPIYVTLGLINLHYGGSSYANGFGISGGALTTLWRREAATAAVYLVNGGSAPNAKGSKALDGQSWRTGVAQVASGAYSLCLGQNNTASGAAAIAIGKGASATSADALCIGTGASSNQTQSMSIGWFPSNTGFLGQVVGRACGNSGTYGCAFGMQSFTSASTSVAVGILNNQTGGTVNATTGAIGGGAGAGTSGINSSAFGVFSTASGLRSVAMGFFSSASGVGSTAIGSGVIGSTANAAYGDQSTAVGYNCRVNTGCTNGVCVGRSCFTSTTSLSSVVMGVLNNSTTATINQATGAISGTALVAAAVGINSVCVGIYNRAASLHAVSMGLDNFVLTGVGGIAIGILNNQSGATLTRTTGAITGTIVAAASGLTSTAMGQYNAASGAQAVAMGNTNFAAGYSSVAVGLLNNQSGATLNSSSGAITGTITAGTVGINSAAVGVKNTASSLRATAFGFLNSASNTNSVAFGYKNVSSTSGSVAMGNGCTAGTGSGPAAVGTFCTATGASSASFGSSCYATGTYSSSFGFLSKANATNSSTIGYKSVCTAGSTNSMAVGTFCFSSATSLSSVAVGVLVNQTSGTLNQATGAITGTPATTTTGINSVALGVNVNAQALRSCAIGVNSVARIIDTTVLCGPIIAQKSTAGTIAQTEAFAQLSGVENALWSSELDMKTNATHTFTLPTGARVFVDKIIVMLSTVGGTITGQLTFTAGITGTNAKILGSTVTTLLTAINKEEQYTLLLTDDGETTLTFTITTAMTGSSTIKGKVCFMVRMYEAE